MRTHPHYLRTAHAGQTVGTSPPGTGGVTPGTVDRVGWLDNADEWLIGGREPRPVVIAEYDPAWPERFEEERTKIASALPEAIRIEHIGSTSVPGLAAKPIIDIIVVVP